MRPHSRTRRNRPRAASIRSASAFARWRLSGDADAPAAVAESTGWLIDRGVHLFGSLNQGWLCAMHAERGDAVAARRAGVATLPDAIKGAVRNNGGGHYNHSLFWVLMAPKGQGGAPSAELAAAMNKAFGSMDDFKAKLADAGMKRFGSGWSWLIKKPDGSLEIVSTPNQDNPLMKGLVDTLGTPLLGVDVWEHAYYLKYQNRRADYLKSWWDVVNWNEVNARFASAK
jgi:superoxide dismutase